MHAAFTHLAAHTVDDDEYQNKGKGTADDQGRKVLPAYVTSIPAFL